MSGPGLALPSTTRYQVLTVACVACVHPAYVLATVSRAVDAGRKPVPALPVCAHRADHRVLAVHHDTVPNQVKLGHRVSDSAFASTDLALQRGNLSRLRQQARRVSDPAMQRDERQARIPAAWTAVAFPSTQAPPRTTATGLASGPAAADPASCLRGTHATNQFSHGCRRQRQTATGHSYRHPSGLRRCQPDWLPTTRLQQQQCSLGCDR